MFEITRKMVSKDAIHYYYKGLEAWLNNDLEKFYSLFEKSLTIDVHPKTLHRLSSVLEKLGKWDEACKYLTKAYSMKNGDHEI